MRESAYSINPIQAYLEAEAQAERLSLLDNTLIEPGTTRTRKTQKSLVRYDPYYDSLALRRFLHSPDCAIEFADIGLLKTDGTSTVAALSFDGRRYVVKRYNTRSPFHALRRTVRKSRAENCWIAAHKLTQIGVTTARPVAMLENRFGPFKGKAYYLTEFADGELCNEYLPALAQQSEIEHIVGRFAGLFRTLVKHRISHGDTKATNFLIHRGQPVVLDLDAMRIHDNTSSLEKGFEKDKRRFLRNWETYPELHALFQKRLQSIKPE